MAPAKTPKKKPKGGKPKLDRTYSADEIAASGRRRPAMASTEISVEAVHLLTDENGNKLQRFQT